MAACRSHGRPAGLLPHGGFSLIELMIGISILAVLLGLALPTFSEWVRNNQVRTAAETLREGLQLARSEAVKQNKRVRLQMVSSLDASCVLSASGPYWIVNAGSSVTPAGSCNSPISLTTAPNVIQASPVTASATRVTLTSRGSIPVVAFDAAGRQTSTLNPTYAPGSPNMFAVDIASASGTCLPAGDVRCLRVQVTTAGEIRMCDPTQTSATDPAICY